MADSSPLSPSSAGVSLRIGTRISVRDPKTAENDPTQEHSGTIRYVGPARFQEGVMEVWVGVELDDEWSGAEAVGVTGERGDGMVGGMRFFSCRPKRALFVKRADLAPRSKKGAADDAAKAAIKLQCLGRQYIARKRVRAMFASHAWNVLDTHLEEMGLQRGAAVARAQFSLQKEQEKIRVHEGQSEEEVVERVMRLAEREVAELTMESLATIRVAKEYDGPHLRFPLNVDSVKAMMEDFKEDKILHYRYLMSLFLKCKQIFSAEPNVQEIYLDGAGEERTVLTVVGDTHGQLDDLFTIFSIKGLPSPKNMFLFNGDFVDRGAKGVEILAVLCAFKILYPNAIFLNRGNHEARAQNAWMGFEEEILAKYTVPTAIVKNDKRAALRVHLLCEQMFDCLPLCAVVQKRVFICHGGLFRNDGVTLNHLRSISRKREPPLNGRSFEDRVFEDILWSDPRPTPHYPRPLAGRRASDRGAGCEFGYAVTQQFCTTNSIALVVRSHECVPEGYEILHNGRLITIFSASRYCGTQTNKGAFITFGPELQPEVQQFYAETQAAAFITEEERQRALEEDAIHMIVEQIVDKKVDLYWYFTKNDVDHTGFVSRVEWAIALTNVLGLNLPFLHYQKFFADVEPDGPFENKINYSKFLSRFQIRGRDEDSSWQDAIIARVCERLYALCTAPVSKQTSEEEEGESRLETSNIEQAWKRFDSNTDGKIEFSEFVETLKSLDVGLTDHQIYELMTSVDADADAHIDFVEFSSRFGPALEMISLAARAQEQQEQQQEQQQEGGGQAEGVVVGRARLPSSPLTPKGSRKAISWDELEIGVLERLRILSRTMYRVEGLGGMPSAFAQFDKGSKGYFGRDEFCAVVTERYEMKDAAEAQLEAMFNAVDVNKSGRVNYIEFLNAFQITDSRAANSQNGNDWRKGVVQQVANVLYQLRVHVRAAFRNFFDVDNDGRISAEDFQSGMIAFNESMDSPLTLMQIEELRRALDKNGDGFISYREFFDGLAIVDDKSLQVPEGDVRGSSKVLVRKSSSFYVQQLERDERLGKIIASKKAAGQGRVQRGKSNSSVTTPTSSSSDEEDNDEVSGINDDDQLV